MPDQGNTITPSYVTISGNTERLIEDSANIQISMNPKNTDGTTPHRKALNGKARVLRSFDKGKTQRNHDAKRLIGRKFDDGWHDSRSKTSTGKTGNAIRLSTQ